MARIVCIEQSTSLRVELKNFIEESFNLCRSSIGYVEPNRIIPMSKDELLLSSSPDLIVIGSSYRVDEVGALSRQIKEIHPECPILIIVTPENYTLRTLRRFQIYGVEVLRTDDEEVRIVHIIDALSKKNISRKKNTLITISGVKGGVGSTSVVSGLAHAFETISKNAVVVDLSRQNAFAFYIGAKSWQSPEHRYLLMEKKSPEVSEVKQMVVTSENGISLLLAPAGGAEVREMWLRDPTYFEISLTIIETLREIFDVVIVDIGTVEGLLPFALVTNADSRIIVSSTDPASIHLLRGSIKQTIEGPGDGKTFVLINEINNQGLYVEDIADFITKQEGVEDRISFAPTLHCDFKAGAWIGTGNSFYTEGTKSTQEILENMCSMVSLYDIDTTFLPTSNFWKMGFNNIFSKKKNTKKLVSPQKFLLETVSENKGKMTLNKIMSPSNNKTKDNIKKEGIKKEEEVCEDLFQSAVAVDSIKTTDEGED